MDASPVDSGDGGDGPDDAQVPREDAADDAGGDAPDDGSAQAFERWKAREPHQYIVQTCTIGIEPPGCVRAAIEGGEVISIAERIYAEGFGAGTFGWEDFTDDQAGTESPLDDMFTRLEAGTEQGCTPQRVEYEAELGYIQSYTLRCGDDVAGGRWVACFEANTNDVERCDVVP